MELPKRIVYVLKSEADSTRYYTGLTSNLALRLDAHNGGRVPHTADGKPWIIDVVLEFADEAPRCGVREVSEVGVRWRVREAALAVSS